MDKAQKYLVFDNHTFIHDTGHCRKFPSSMSMRSDMADIGDSSEPTSSIKRPLEQDNILPKQPVLPGDSVMTKAKKLERSGLIDTNGNHFDGTESAEPESKRVKLDNSKAEVGSHKVDARDKVKGVALVKEEYVKKLVHEDLFNLKLSSV